MTQRTCSIDGCDAPSRARGWCNRHYSRWLKCGDPTELRRFELLDTPQRRFWQKVQVEPESGCWRWVGTRQPEGYGLVTIGRRSLKAHRVAYEWMRGPIPDGLHIDHLCRTRECVNPAHLEAVKPALNTNRGLSASVAPVCVAGHSLEGENLYLWTNPKNGYVKRSCRECKREYLKTYRESRG